MHDCDPASDTAFTDAVDVGPDIDAQSWRFRVPGRAACYVLEDADARPVIAATVGDLRAALMRRLGPDAVPDDTVDADDATSGSPVAHRKIDYRQVTRRVRWRPVFSRFEGNLVYLENVRTLFPKTFHRLIRPWRAHWIAVDPTAAAPRFDVVDRPVWGASPTARYLGPFPTAPSARRHVQMLEDVFDLCRYHHILAQAPRGEACAYKQMNRCPAPCDGSITMDAYRTQINAALALLDGGADAWRAQTHAAMKTAAAELAFEHAARLKAKIDAARIADAPQAALVRPLADFRYVALQGGDRKGHVRVFLIGPGSIRYAGQIDKTNRDAMLPALAADIDALRRRPLESFDTGDTAAARIGLVAWHLLAAPRDAGLFLAPATLPDPAFLAAALDTFLASPAVPIAHLTSPTNAAHAIAPADDAHPPA